LIDFCLSLVLSNFGSARLLLTTPTLLSQRHRFRRLIGAEEDLATLSVGWEIGQAEDQQTVRVACDRVLFMSFYFLRTRHTTQRTHPTRTQRGAVANAARKQHKKSAKPKRKSTSKSKRKTEERAERKRAKKRKRESERRVKRMVGCLRNETCLVLSPLPLLQPQLRTQP
jgi:hypothetical protein